MSYHSFMQQRRRRAFASGSVAIDPNPLLNAEAYWWTARSVSGDRQALVGQGLATGIDLVFGVAGADAADPLDLTGPYLYCPGVGGNYGTGSLGLTDGFHTANIIRVEARVEHASWRPSVTEAFIGGGSTHNQFAVTTTGTLTTTFVSAASVAFTPASTVTVPSGLALRWVAWEFNATTGIIRFYTSEQQTNDPTAVVWTQLGADVAVGFTGNRLSSSLLPIVGQANTITSSPFIGCAYRARWLTVPTVIFDIDFTRVDLVAANATSMQALVGSNLTFTFNRTSTGRKLCMVVDPRLLFATDDYLTTPDNPLFDFAAAESFTIMASLRRFGIPGSNQVIIGKKTATGTPAGWALLHTSSDSYRFEIGDGAIGIGSTIANPGTGVGVVLTGRRNVGADNIQTSVNGSHGSTVADTTTATLANAESVRVGRYSGAGTNFLDGEIRKLAIIRRYVTNAELAAFEAEMAL